MTWSVQFTFGAVTEQHTHTPSPRSVDRKEPQSTSGILLPAAEFLFAMYPTSGGCCVEWVYDYVMHVCHTTYVAISYLLSEEVGRSETTTTAVHLDLYPTIEANGKIRFGQIIGASMMGKFCHTTSSLPCAIIHDTSNNIANIAVPRTDDIQRHTKTIHTFSAFHFLMFVLCIVQHPSSIQPV